ncbi:MAG: 50S ribosomal protein L33 [bacterium]
MRQQVILVCSVCKEKNYHTAKNKTNTTGRMELKKYCKRCRNHTIHREAK